MPSYVITGASRGLGFAFLQNLSSDPANTVIGLVRDLKATEAKVAELHRDNVHIFKADLDDYDSLKKAAQETTKLTGGSLDYLIANAVRADRASEFLGLSELGADPVALEKEMVASYKTNVVGNIHLFNLFLPLILKGQKKKVVFLSTGMADIELIRKFDVHIGGTYAANKAAANAVVAKYSAEYGKHGVLFISISPGFVDTGNYDPSTMTEEQMKGLASMQSNFAAYAPHFKAPLTPEESVKAVIKVYENASVANGDGGSFISHLGTKQWL